MNHKTTFLSAFFLVAVATVGESQDRVLFKFDNPDAC